MRRECRGRAKDEDVETDKRKRAHRDVPPDTWVTLSPAFPPQEVSCFFPHLMRGCPSMR